MKYSTAEEVELENQKADVAVAKAMEKKKAEEDRKKNPLKISVAGFESAKVKKQTPQVLEFSVKSKTAKASVSKWIATQKASGWQVESTIDESEVGEYALTKEDKVLTLSFIDPGFIPGEITLKTKTGFQLELLK
ncbi:MAG: hypothetical protein R3C11_28740 [Planctomycetaceae bacterium]